MNWALPAADTYFAPILEADPRGFQIAHLELALTFCRHHRNEAMRTAVDGGAHIGSWSVHLAAEFRRVVAIEPAADTFDCLVKNTESFSNIAYYPCALSDKAGRGRIVDDVTRPGNTGSRYLELVEDDGARGPAATSIEVIPLDYLYLRDLDFLKLDVEGHELRALKGAAGTIGRCSPVILIEVKRLRPDVDPEEAVRWLAETFNYHEAARAGRDRIYVRG